MRELPTGTVTFLFSDIEGSTRLLHELGDRYADLLGEHRRKLRSAFARHGGVEVDTQGDAFFVVFSRATDAVAAATDGQRALSEGPIRARMGLHTGEPLVTSEGYVGMDVHRAARIAAAGHGGQLLLSQTTRDLLDAAIELRDLGEHRLKDLTTPERIYQVGGDEYPPLKSLNQTNLPLQPTALIGRERELGELLELIRGHPLVTLTGPGGSGKTRLALHAAAELVEELADGVWFISLAALRDSDLVLPTIAQTVGVKEPITLHDHLRGKETLLLLDNFEQLLEAGPQLAELLRHASAVKLLVTSRAPLHLSGEREYAVPPLADDEAVALFVERVRAAKPSFEPDEHVGKICRRLDNLPLAVELAAARSKVLKPAQMLERLRQRLPLLTGGPRDAPERQRTLGATIEWSYDLLTEEEKRLFSRLAVFAGSFELEAAEEVCAADLDRLASLIDNSLLRQAVGGRFFMLETIREYAAERFEADRAADVLRRRHAEWIVRVAEAASALHREGFQVLRAEHENARAALDFLGRAGEAELALRLVTAFGDYWFVRGYAREGHLRMREALARSEQLPAKLRIPALNRASSLARLVGDVDGAGRYASTAVELARELGDAAALAIALRELGEAMVVQGDYDQASSLYEQAIEVARAAGESPVAAVTNLADAALAVGEFEDAIAYSAEAAGLSQGPDGETVGAIAAFNTASALIQLGRPEEARPHLRNAMDTVLTVDYPELIGWCLAATAALAAATAPAESGVLLGAADAAMEAVGIRFGPAEQRLRRWALSAVGERCDQVELEDAFRRGRELHVEGAVALARQYLD